MQPLLLLTDGVPTPNGAGSNQTLANLLSGYPGELIYLEANDETQEGFDERMSVSIIHFPVSKLKFLHNRLGLLINDWILQKQLSYLSKLGIATINLPKPDQCSVLLSTTVIHKLLMGHKLLKAGYNVIPYFMDDWISNKNIRWKGGNIQRITKDILEAAYCWLMISRQLEKTFRERYSLMRKPCLVVHNPSPAPYMVPIEKERAAVQLAQLRSEIRNLPASTPARVKHSGGADQAGQKSEIIYAGSIWPMHADALIATAKAVHLMQETSSVVGRRSSVVPGLIIYTSEAHWKKYRSQLEGPGVTYGGWKTYADMQQILPSAWLLLCSASFDGKHKAYSDSSVQTKLTDYMAAGKPVLFVGPSEAASGVFVEEWDIGFTVATQLPSDIAASLEAISRMDKAYDRKANNGAVLATTTFSKPVVQQKLYDFLEQYAIPAQVTGSSV